MTTSASQRPLRVPAPTAAPMGPVDWAKVGRSTVRRYARGMTYPEILSALAEARNDARLGSSRDDSTGDGGERGEAELAEWERIAQLLAGSGAPYDPGCDALVQYELAEWERIEQLRAGSSSPSESGSDTLVLNERARSAATRVQPDEQAADWRQAEKAEAAPQSPEAARRALLHALTSTQLLESLAADERRALERLSHTDPEAALTLSTLVGRAFVVGQTHRESHTT